MKCLNTVGEVKDAMNKIKKKLISERGASIAMALLIFLVCTVVGSAVLVAGTAASGRMSKLAENDQRYYAVNSAVRMLRKTMENETITVEKEVGSTDVLFYINDEKKEVTDTSFFPSFASEAAYLLTCTTDFAGRPPTEFDYGPSITDSGSAGITEALRVKVKEEIDPNGTIYFTVSKGQTGSEYKIIMTFAPDKKTQSTLEDTADGTQKEIVTTILQWKLNDIATVSDKPTITTNAFSGDGE